MDTVLQAQHHNHLIKGRTSSLGLTDPLPPPSPKGTLPTGNFFTRIPRPSSAKLLPRESAHIVEQGYSIPDARLCIFFC